MFGVSQRYSENVQSIFELEFIPSYLNGNILFVDTAPIEQSTTVIQRLLSFPDIEQIDVLSKNNL